MLKFFFWTLLLGNGALFAYHQGYFDSFISSGREPARLAQQLNADKIRLLPANAKATNGPAPEKPAGQPAPTDAPAAAPALDKTAQAEAPASTAAVMETALTATEKTATEKKADADKPADTVALPERDKKPEPEKKTETDKKTEVLACTEIGNFSETDAGRFEARLAALAPGVRLSRRTVREAGSHIVYIPPQGSKENADRKVEQLRSLGVTDFYVMQDQSDMRWGISLGVFSSEESARKRLEALKQQGVRTARIGARNTISKVAIQLRALDAAGREKLEKLKPDFPQQQQRKCA